VRCLNLTQVQVWDISKQSKSSIEGVFAKYLRRNYDGARVAIVHARDGNHAFEKTSSYIIKMSNKGPGANSPVETLLVPSPILRRSCHNYVFSKSKACQSNTESIQVAGAASTNEILKSSPEQYVFTAMSAKHKTCH
jgi:hypothetical protein